ncbi:hypothetical protein AVEN_50669-1 [Araneus ventricosus]|uniref:Uncharacterized protein n=1 Tax=Araneus ventricosus TaxID=182803 RepID=A0A4Y2JJD6_ARAVE|nr:hypothetical protein AVEN_50669-1 [Araneus ventricosus]
MNLSRALGTGVLRCCQTILLSSGRASEEVKVDNRWSKGGLSTLHSLVEVSCRMEVNVSIVSISRGVVRYCTLLYTRAVVPNLFSCADHLLCKKIF